MTRLYLVRRHPYDYAVILTGHSDVGKILINRPTYWKLFLESVAVFVLGAVPDYQFAAIDDESVQKLLHGKKYGVLRRSRIIINGDSYETYPWTFRRLCLFCWQGLTFGTFFNFLKWRW